MPRLSLLLLVALAACAAADTGMPPRPVELQGWRLASGKTPTRAEYEAVMASCRDGSGLGSLDTCLATLGLQRSR